MTDMSDNEKSTIVLRRLYQNIVDCLQVLADEQKQRCRSDRFGWFWLPEYYSMLFDDNHIEQLVSTNYNVVGLSESQRKALGDYVQSLNQFQAEHDIDVPTDELLQSPAWLALCKQAAELLRVLPEPIVPD